MTAQRKSWGREYAAHRRAYTPRLWPLAFASGAVVVVGIQLLDPPIWIAVPATIVLAVLVGRARWAIWRRRHPVITPDEYAADWREAMRRAARWN